MNYLAFDIETARLTPDGEEWLSHRPLGISCYALAWQTPESDESKGGESQSICNHGKDGTGNPQPKMSRAECQDLVQELLDFAKQGYTLLTWNGLGFDFNVLAEESGMHQACCDLARAHVDMMFHFFCIQGYPVGLNAAAKGMGLAGKVEGMDGSQAPRLWQQGEYDKVLAYVTQDVVTTLALARAVEERGQLRWQSRKGKPNRVLIPKWLTVTEALALPLPDIGWIRKPMTRDGFCSWMEQQH